MLFTIQIYENYFLIFLWFVVVQSPSHVWLFATPWTAACQAFLYLTISRSLPKFMSIALVMPSIHLILWYPLLLCPQSFPASGTFPMSQLFARRDWGQEEKGTIEDEMAGWHHRLDGREFKWTLGVGDGQGGLVCCDSWGCKELDTTERMNWTELNLHHMTKILEFQLQHLSFQQVFRVDFP